MCKRIMLDTGANAYGVVTDQFIKENNWPGVWLSRERGKAHSASSSIVVGGTYCTGFLLDQRTTVIARMMVIESSAPLCPLIGCDFVTALNANVRFGTGEMSILADAAKGERWVVKWEPYKGVLTRPLLRIPHDDTWKKYEVDEKLTILRRPPLNVKHKQVNAVLSAEASPSQEGHAAPGATKEHRRSNAPSTHPLPAARQDSRRTENEVGRAEQDKEKFGVGIDSVTVGVKLTLSHI